MTTFVIGVEDEKVEGTIERIGEACSPASEPGMRRATLFILKVDNFIQI
jgi:uncharacterized protein YaaQ